LHKTRQRKTRKDKTRQDKTRQDETRPPRKRQDEEKDKDKTTGKDKIIKKRQAKTLNSSPLTTKRQDETDPTPQCFSKKEVSVPGVTVYGSCVT
jgi:hypothetical protein